MREKFIALDRVKRDKIINVAMQEFARKGFKKASTNEIVQKAEISKGALFHYFSSKWDLFEFLCEYAIETFEKATPSEIENLPSDLFERSKTLMNLKYAVIVQYPLIIEFIISVENDEDPQVQKYVSLVHTQIHERHTQELYANVDTSKFRSDVDIEKAFQVIHWVFEGFIASKKKNVDFEKIKEQEILQSAIHETIEELDSYLELLKKIFYS